MNKSTI